MAKIIYTYTGGDVESNPKYFATVIYENNKKPIHVGNLAFRLFIYRKHVNMEYMYIEIKIFFFYNQSI